jgi:hypothetical protein
LRQASAARPANRLGELGAAEPGPDLLTHVQAEIIGLLAGLDGLPGGIEHVPDMMRFHALLAHGLDDMLYLAGAHARATQMLREVRQLHRGTQASRELTLQFGCRCRTVIGPLRCAGCLRVCCPAKEHRTGQHGHSNVHGQLHSLGL